MVFAALSARLKPCPFKAGFMQPVLAGESYAIGAHFAGCGKDTVGALFSVFNALIAPESAVALADGPTHGDEGFAGVNGNAGLEMKQATRGEIRWIFSHGLRGAFVMPAWAVAGSLHVESVVDAIDDDLGLSLRLHVAAHDAKGEPGHAVFGKGACRARRDSDGHTLMRTARRDPGT